MSAIEAELKDLMVRGLDGDAARTLATGLDPAVEHTLSLVPFTDRPGPAEWRIESICVAGPGAMVRR